MKDLEMARTVVGLCGPAPQASDVGELRIAFARANAEVKVGGWCNCPQGGKYAKPGEVFFQHENGAHGWMCVACLRTTQVG